MPALAETHRNAFLISGSGTTMAEMVKAIQSGEVPNTEVACVIASKPSAGGIQRAIDLGIPRDRIAVIEKKKFKGTDGEVNQEALGLEILAMLRAHETTSVTQNGWMVLTPEVVINAFPDAIFNQHPGPLPDFGKIYGMQVHAAVLNFGKKVARSIETMAIAQRVAPGYDDGAVVLYETVPVYPDDTPSDIQQRVLPREYALQILLLQQIASGTVTEKVPPRIVRPDEEHFVFEAIQEAVAEYPHG